MEYLCKYVELYLRSPHSKLEFREWWYPTKPMLKAVNKKLTHHYLEKKNILFSFKNHNSFNVSKRFLNAYFGDEYDTSQEFLKENETIKPKYLVIIFPDHKPHLKKGIWSRSVSLFDNLVRGTMIPLVESCIKENGWGVLLMNPNENKLSSDKFIHHPPHKLPLSIPKNEGPNQHVLSVADHFIKPFCLGYSDDGNHLDDSDSDDDENDDEINKNIKQHARKSKNIHIQSKVDELLGDGNRPMKLLLCGYGDGGSDIIHLLQQRKIIRDNTIGIAFIDFYNFTENEWDKEVRQIIEQKSAMYLSLGTNDDSSSPFGFEPSTAESNITIFKTPNQEKRYGPCYNSESVVRFFRSKIELHKQQTK